MATQGMDVAAVKALAQELEEARGEIDRIGSQLTEQLHGVDWTGPDADTFRGSWDSDVKPGIDDVARVVGAMGQDATQQAGQQESISAH